LIKKLILLNMSHFKAFTFDGKSSARKAYDKLEDSNNSWDWFDDIAEISVNKRGTYRVHSTWAQDSSNVPGGIGFGALLGGALGMLFGPGGAIAAAAVEGSVGGLIGHHLNVKFNDPVLDNFAASLLNDTSALVIIGDKLSIAALSEALAEYKLKTFETELDEEVEKALRKALK
jgi:uncharacterized membrane protein